VGLMTEPPFPLSAREAARQSGFHEQCVKNQ
jgi:hypothetical protein